MKRLLVSFWLFAVPAQAQDLVFSPEATEACLAAVTSNYESCIGHSADACMLDTPGGDSTVGMGACLARELDYWDARLNATYRALMERHRVTDVETREYAPSAPSLAEALRAMQRAWVPYRDAACDYERAQWSGGTGGSPATAGCLMHLTGRQALELEARLALAE